MNIGDKRMETPTIYCKLGIEVTGPQKCTVTYIHPECRFYQVEFTSQLERKFRECFYFADRMGHVEAPRISEEAKHSKKKTRHRPVKYTNTCELTKGSRYHY